MDANNIFNSQMDFSAKKKAVNFDARSLPSKSLSKADASDSKKDDFSEKLKKFVEKTDKVDQKSEVSVSVAQTKAPTKVEKMENNETKSDLASDGKKLPLAENANTTATNKEEITKDAITNTSTKEDINDLDVINRSIKEPSQPVIDTTTSGAEAATTVAEVATPVAEVAATTSEVATPVAEVTAATSEVATPVAATTEAVAAVAATPKDLISNTIPTTVETVEEVNSQEEEKDQSLNMFLSQLNYAVGVSKEPTTAEQIKSPLAGAIDKETLVFNPITQALRANDKLSPANGEVVNSVNYANQFVSPATDGMNNNSSNAQQQNPAFDMQKQFFNQDKILLAEKPEQDTSNIKMTEALKLANAETTTQVQAKTAASTEINIKTPVMHKNWGVDFNNNVAMMAKNGGGHAKIKLNPMNLGPIEAQIKIVNEVATVHIVANHAVTRDAIDASIPRLREMLEGQGFTQVDVNVSEQGFAKENKKSGSEGKGGNNQQSLVDGEDDLNGEGNNETAVKSEINGVVDFYA